MIYPKKKTKKDHHKPKKIIAADRSHPNFRHFMVEKYEIKVYKVLGASAGHYALLVVLTHY